MDKYLLSDLLFNLSYFLNYISNFSPKVFLNIFRSFFHTDYHGPQFQDGVPPVKLPHTLAAPEDIHLPGISG